MARLQNYFQQNNDHSCGPYALSFFLKLYGYDVPSAQCNKLLTPSKKFGTPTVFMERVLRELDVPYRVIDYTEGDYFAPCLVNLSLEDEGHWGVVVSFGATVVTWYDPYIGEIRRESLESFERRWYSVGHSEKYGLVIEQ
jgi:ABC-type bacteriocin/lantibiotic exporter with double-glycine peptidase domain